MNPRNKLLGFGALLAGVALAWGGRVAWLAHHNLVSLDVRDMEVRLVVKKIEAQTWETILVPQDVQGKITLQVKNAPLEGVLDLVSSQANSRSRHIYPIYSHARSLEQLKKLVQTSTSNSVAVASSQWTNFSFAPRGFGGGGGGPGGFGGFGPVPGTGEGVNKGLISLKFSAKPASSVAQSLSAAGRMVVVPEDGVSNFVSLTFTNATREEAVTRLARSLNRQWDDFYLLQPMRLAAQRPPPSGEEEAGREERMAARLQSLTPEQKARMEEMQALSPEERQARMVARMEDPTVQAQATSRMMSDLRSSTPEQIVQKKRLRQQMMKNRPGRPQ